ncbi:ORF53 [Ovine gammaherpesvirus 2]|uniref:ORF53 n=1 Tax=Ovine gammaherpesvirus 2 TaxID=10398 RepID=Q2VSI7_9GAMA|nr:ORF53 [Ovine gammaherpesvirus 2]AAX58089.1 ORF53 [Ovine gammaherpesvirus 2]WOZ69498.1 ORF53 glycoprotein N [Ovine gammaherpesvirus 2]
MALARAKLSIFLLGTWQLFVTCLVNANLTTPSRHVPILNETGLMSSNVDFYSYSCNADTFVLRLNSFSSVWALINVFVVLISAVVYMTYVCFTKFVNTLIYQ